MTSEETSSHQRYHVGLAGPLFSDDDAALIRQTSRGYPRTVNSVTLQAPSGTSPTGPDHVPDGEDLRCCRTVSA